jgi:DNA-binding LacI/PurR family transcriptional regulator
LILNGPQEINVFNDRLQGVLEILSSCDPACVIQQEHSFDETAGFEAVQDVLSRGDRPTAILALSDWMAIGALRALRQAGLQVPGDVSLIGFSDLPVATLLDPPLTTVRIPQRRLGRLAVHLLHALIEGDVEGPVGMVLPLDLALRASTAAPAQEGHGRL